METETTEVMPALRIALGRGGIILTHLIYLECVVTMVPSLKISTNTCQLQPQLHFCKEHNYDNVVNCIFLND